MVEAADGDAAWAAFGTPAPPLLAVLDWLMPGKSGPELCQLVRARKGVPPYLILLTAMHSHADIAAALEVGADDYIVKPFNAGELRARVGVGVRVVTLQQTLTARVAELEEALANNTRLQGLLPICAWCRRVRDDQDYWQQIETYLSHRSDIRFTHGICAECRAKLEA